MLVLTPCSEQVVVRETERVATGLSAVEACDDGNEDSTDVYDRPRLALRRRDAAADRADRWAARVAMTATRAMTMPA